MRTYPQHTAQNGAAYARLCIGAGGRPTIRISLLHRKSPSATIGFSIGQAEAVIDVLAGVVADSRKPAGSGRFPKHQARNGRAHAVLQREFESASIWLTVSLGTDRFINLPISVAQAEGLFCAMVSALRDAEAHRAGEGA